MPQYIHVAKNHVGGMERLQVITYLHFYIIFIFNMSRNLLDALFIALDSTHVLYN